MEFIYIVYNPGDTLVMGACVSLESAIGLCKRIDNDDDSELVVYKVPPGERFDVGISNDGMVYPSKQ